MLRFMCSTQTNRACPLLFILFLCLFRSYGPFNYISVHKFSKQYSAFSLCSPNLISALLVLLTMYLFVKVSLNGLKVPRSGELRTQKLKSHLMRTQSLKILPLKPGVGQYKAIHATLTARDFFLVNFYPSGPFTCIFPKLHPSFPVLAVLTLVPL